MNKPQTHPITLKKDAKKQYFFIFWLFKFKVVVRCVFKLNIWQFLRSLKTCALGNRLSRHGLATALVIRKGCHVYVENSWYHPPLLGLYVVRLRKAVDHKSLYPLPWVWRHILITPLNKLHKSLISISSDFCTLEFWDWFLLCLLCVLSIWDQSIKTPFLYFMFDLYTLNVSCIRLAPALSFFRCLHGDNSGETALEAFVAPLSNDDIVSWFCQMIKGIWIK